MNIHIYIYIIYIYVCIMSLGFAPVQRIYKLNLHILHRFAIQMKKEHVRTIKLDASTSLKYTQFIAKLVNRSFGLIWWCLIPFLETDVDTWKSILGIPLNSNPQRAAKPSS